MPRFEHFMLVCNNAGQPGDTRPRCAKRGADELLARLRARVAERGAKSKVRIIRSGCLDLCAKGCAVAAFSARPDGLGTQETWYTKLGPDDAEALYDAHVERGERYVPASSGSEPSA